MNIRYPIYEGVYRILTAVLHFHHVVNVRIPPLLHACIIWRVCASDRQAGHVSNPPRVQSDIKPVTHSHMGERLPYYVLTYPRSPVTGRFKATIHHVPDAHLDDWTAGHMLTCGKITIIFPDWHYHGGLLTVCDTVCHPVTPPKCPGDSGFGYSKSDKDGGGRIL